MMPPGREAVSGGSKISDALRSPGCRRRLVFCCRRMTMAAFLAVACLGTVPAGGGPAPASLHGRDFFHLEPPPTPPPPSLPPAAPPPSLPPEPSAPSPVEFLVLRGVVIGSPSLALIEDRRSGRLDLFQAGALVAGARVTAVEAGQVRLEGSGEELLLRLEGLAPPAASGPVPLFSDREPVIMPADTGGERTAAPGVSVAAPELSLSNLSREMLSLHEELGRLQVSPLVREGRVAGYQVRNFGSGRLAEMAGRFGFREGDTVIRVNDRAIGGLADLAEMYRAVSPGEAVRVVVLRGGEEVALDFNVTP